jgi:hypothetical protein
VYFLPADGGEKVIKIRRFSNETAIENKNAAVLKSLKQPLSPTLLSGANGLWVKFVDNIFSPADGGGKRRDFNYFETRPANGLLV